jgi:hypothetical protein
MKNILSAVFYTLLTSATLLGQAPANDDACNAISIPVNGSVNNYNNNNATVQTGEGVIAPPTTGFNQTDGWGESTISFSTWFKFTAPTSGNVSISCTDVAFDGQVAVYQVGNCSDFSTFNMVAANDNAIDSSSTAPEFTICDLTPGNTYYLLFDSGSTLTTGSFSIKISILTISAGTPTTVLDVCTGDTANLFDGISGYDLGGTWYETIPTFGLNGSEFYTAGVGFLTFDFKYVIENGCLADSSISQVHVFGPSTAGDDGMIMACKGEVINLMSGLSGTVDLGGTWYDPTNQPLSGFFTTASTIPGQFNYDYIANNGVCPNDTANIVLMVSDCIADLDELSSTSITIYPNPSNGIITISNTTSGEVFSYELTDMSGRLIKSEEFGIQPFSQSEIDLRDQHTGMYIVRVYNSKEEQLYRVILN